MAAVANSGGALISLKNKMQGLRDEMEKTRQQLEIKTQEIEQEKSLRIKVILNFSKHHFCLNLKCIF